MATFLDAKPSVFLGFFIFAHNSCYCSAVFSEPQSKFDLLTCLESVVRMLHAFGFFIRFLVFRISAVTFLIATRDFANLRQLSLIASVTRPLPSVPPDINFCLSIVTKYV